MKTAFVQGQLVRGRRRFASYVVHAGAVVVLVSIAVSSTMRTSKEATLSRGQSATLGAYTVTFNGADVRQEPHRESTVASFVVTKDGKTVRTLAPRMNQYASMREPIGTPDVYSTLTGDVYLSLMNVDVPAQSAGVLIIHTPMVGWIWISVIVMGLGGVMALIPTGRRVYAVVPAQAVEIDTEGAAAR